MYARYGKTERAGPPRMRSAKVAATTGAERYPGDRVDVGRIPRRLEFFGHLTSIDKRRANGPDDREADPARRARKLDT